MRKQNLQARIDKLKALPAAMDMESFFGKTFDALMQMDWVTLGCYREDGTEMTPEDFILKYEKKNGTRENFIKRQAERWKRRIK